MDSAYSILSNSLLPHGLQPTRLLCLWDSPGKNSGVDCYFLTPGCLPNPGTKPASPALTGRSSITESPEKPLTMGDVPHFLLDISPLFKLGYNCFTMLCQILPYNEVNQPYLYVYPFPLNLPPTPSSHPSRSSQKTKMKKQTNKTATDDENQLENII